MTLAAIESSRAAARSDAHSSRSADSSAWKRAADLVIEAALAVAPALALLACIGCHIVVSHVWRRLRRDYAAAAAALSGLVGLVTLAIALPVGTAGMSSRADRVSLAIAWSLAYLALTYWYIFGFYNLGESARRIRLLIELEAVGERGLSRTELLSLYNARMIVEARLGRMLASGQVIERNGRFVIGRPLMLYGARALVVLKLALLGARSEFRSPSPR
jgi:hypothetical protein